jgi:tetrapyrrole methylase family protein / MazG family protein
MRDMKTPENLDRFATLVAILARLRSPGGCPWDRQQTHRSLREHLLSECYETLATLDEGDPGKLREELGDLLLQIVFHAQIASEAGEFQIEDVIRSINEKLIRRHPHVFGGQPARDAEEVSLNWELLKKEERAPGAPVLGSVPQAMPALAYSHEIQRRVARVGFDWKDIGGVIEKLNEEINELKEAANQEERAAEFGDLLFTLVNVARRLGIDSESSLRGANQRFFRRFTRMEELCRQRGQDFSQLSPEAQNVLWEEAKRVVG